MKNLRKFYFDFRDKYPLAWQKLFKSDVSDITVEKNGDATDAEFEMFVKNQIGKFDEFNNWILSELKASGIDAYLGRTIQEKGTLYKPMIVDIREFNSTITYFLVNEDDKQVWQKLAYEEMSEFNKAKHFAGYDSLEIANNILISKAFGILNTKLYGQ